VSALDLRDVSHRRPPHWIPDSTPITIAAKANASRRTKGTAQAKPFAVRNPRDGQHRQQRA